MIQWERPVFSSPFELWKEEGVLFLVLQPGATMKTQDMKEVIRLIAALDRSGKAPVFLEYPGNFAVQPGARDLLRRVCGAQGHPVAFYTTDPVSRQQGEYFKEVQRPAFPFRVFQLRDQAFAWTRERLQLVELLS